MHATTISHQQFADLFDNLRDVEQRDRGAYLVTTGHHPRLGNTVIVQTVDAVQLLSELPAGEAV